MMEKPLTRLSDTNSLEDLRKLREKAEVMFAVTSGGQVKPVLSSTVKLLAGGGGYVALSAEPGSARVDCIVDASIDYNEAVRIMENLVSDEHANDILVAVDVQVDFITGTLANQTAVEKVPLFPALTRKFSKSLIIATKDTHDDDYLSTLEGKNLPVKHCIRGTSGWELEPGFQEALKAHACTYVVEKPTFGHLDWATTIKEAASLQRRTFDGAIYIFGFCTDICVVSNALILRACFPNRRIVCLGSFCAGTTKTNHDSAISVMRSCQIEVR